MENFSEDRRCLICCRTTHKISSVASQKLVSTASLLQDFLNCFHINVLDSEVHDLPTSCQFCPNCEQFLAEWSSIQIQMTQLTRRAAHLKATLSALLLSPPQMHEQNHDEDVTQIINHLPRLLQQAVDDIRNELRTKYSVRVMLEKIQLPSGQKVYPLPNNFDNIDKASGHRECGANTQLPFVLKLEPPLDVQYNDDEPWYHWEYGVDDHDKEHLPSEDRMDPEETSDGIVVASLKTEEEIDCDYSTLQDSAHSKEMEVKAGIIETSGCPRKSEKQSAVIQDGPNSFKYNGFGLKLNDVDQCYWCEACGFKGTTSIHSVLAHIRTHHYTAEDKLKFTAIRTSDTEWVYGGEYKIIKVDEKFNCVSCGSVKSSFKDLISHIRAQHIDLAPANKFVCEICGKELLGQPYYRMHMKRHQTAPMKCPICKKRFLCKYSFQAHIKVHELGEGAMKYQCEYCSRKYSSPKSYKDHRRIHTGETPFACQVCGMKFGFTSLLSRHRKAVHGIQPTSRRLIKVCK